jgi:outer membrane lipoprotein-sorting protein
LKTVRSFNQKRGLNVKYAVAFFLIFLYVIILSGCQLLRPPAPISYNSGANFTSLSSNASLSYTSVERSISGSGFLMYKKPDQMRMVVLSPFGSVLQEVFVSGEMVTIIDSGNGIAFSGTINDLPQKGDFSAWRHIHWLIDIDPPDSSRTTAVIERVNRFGTPERASFENGLLVSKTTASGGLIRYGRYTATHGVPFPQELTYETTAKETFSIRLEDTEIDIPFAVDAFVPKLDKLRIYPLSSLR